MSETIEIQYPYWVFTFLLNFEKFDKLFLKKWRNLQNSNRQRMRSKWANVKKSVFTKNSWHRFQQKSDQNQRKEGYWRRFLPVYTILYYFSFSSKKRLFIAISRERKSPKVSLFSQNPIIFRKSCKLSLLSNVLIPQYFRLEIYRGFPYQNFDFLDIGEFLTNFGNSGFWKFIGDFLIYFSTFWI